MCLKRVYKSNHLETYDAGVANVATSDLTKVNRRFETGAHKRRPKTITLVAFAPNRVIEPSNTITD